MLWSLLYKYFGLLTLFFSSFSVIRRVPHEFKIACLEVSLLLPHINITIILNVGVNEFESNGAFGVECLEKAFFV